LPAATAELIACITTKRDPFPEICYLANPSYVEAINKVKGTPAPSGIAQWLDSQGSHGGSHGRHGKTVK